MAFFGVRGVGSIYYIAYAAGHATFPEERWLWSTVGFAVALSVVLHGVLATPVMRRLDVRRDHESAREAGTPDPPSGLVEVAARAWCRWPRVLGAGEPRVLGAGGRPVC